jgi:hypothetical protein
MECAGRIALIPWYRVHARALEGHNELRQIDPACMHAEAIRPRLDPRHRMNKNRRWTPLTRFVACEIASAI